MLIGQILGIGFLMGFLGSAHCIGMCGPLVMALPFSQQKGVFKYLSMILYHFGKIMSYATLGVLAGLFGKQLFIVDTQQTISILIGAIMLVYVVWVFLIKVKTKLNPLGILQAPILKALSTLFKSKYIVSYILVGFLNGLLPCGMVYLALGSALATASIFNGALFMTFFGIGTAPALLLVAMGGQLMSYPVKQKLQRVLPLFIFGMGIVLILRGMNLGIPFISPHIETAEAIVSCHN
jgi:sulfite exporter TauE/SafE